MTVLEDIVSTMESSAVQPVPQFMVPWYCVNLKVLNHPVPSPVIHPVVTDPVEISCPFSAPLYIGDIPVIICRNPRHLALEEVGLSEFTSGVDFLTLTPYVSSSSQLFPLEKPTARYQYLMVLVFSRFHQLARVVLSTA